jgi:hypothetical protein
MACLLLALTGRGFDDYLDFVPGSACISGFEARGENITIRAINVDPSEARAVLLSRAPR